MDQVSKRYSDPCFFMDGMIQTCRFSEFVSEFIKITNKEKEEAFECKNEYMFGSELLICPVTTKLDDKTKTASTKVWLPDGRWTNIFDGKIYKGGQEVVINSPINTIPVLAKSGAIIPMSADSGNTWECPEHLNIYVYRGNNAVDFYEDDGETANYKNGEFSITKMSVEEVDDTLKFTIKGGKQLKCIPQQRIYTLDFKDVEEFDEVKVTINGVETPVSYGRSFVSIEDVSVEDEIIVTLTGVVAKKNKPIEERVLDCLTHLNGSNIKKALTNSKLKNCKTMDEVCGFLHTPVEKSCKAVVYQRNEDDSFVVAFLRGDYEVNETKLRNFVGAELHPAEITEDSPLVAGYIGPVGISENVTCVFDVSLKGIDSLIAGANKEGHHVTGLNLERELGNVTYVDVSKVKEGGICPCCGKPALTVKRGIEVGNIFQLGTKYTESMNMQFADKEGVLHHPIMGCYGIGVGRLAASICEAKHDDYGPIWPISVAPWEVHLCCLRPDDEETKKVADTLYEALQKNDTEVIYDDREGIRGGQMFADADLIGAPIRIVVSPRNLKENKLEISTRDKSLSEKVDVAEGLSYILDLKQTLFQRIADGVR